MSNKKKSSTASNKSNGKKYDRSGELSFMFYAPERDVEEFDNLRAIPDWTLTEYLVTSTGNHISEIYYFELLRRMISFATEFGLSGNIWQKWLTYNIILHENAFSLACERRSINSDATALTLVNLDMEMFRTYFGLTMPFPDMADYIPAVSSETENIQGKYISDLSDTLAGAGDTTEFLNILIGHYQKYGVGIYGLYRAFRIDDAVCGTPGGSFGRGNGFGQSSCADTAIRLVPVTDSRNVSFDDLIGYEEQKERLKANTEAFVSGRIANNVLLYGDSGTGKSTSVHALMNEYYDRGLRLVELSKQHRHLLPQVLSMIKKRNYRFIIFLDDLSFEENESDYKELKAMLEGALETRADRVLIYATSNRRHLIKETWTDRNDMEYQNDLHHSDTMEEKLSLASRFGVTIYYSKPDQKEYFEIVHGLTSREGLEIDEQELNDLARKWELRHGGRTGRAASQLVTWLQGQSRIES